MRYVRALHAHTIGIIDHTRAWLINHSIHDTHKVRTVESAHSFFSRYEEEGEEFLDKIVTGDETLIPFVNLRIQKQRKNIEAVDAYSLVQQAEEVRTNFFQSNTDGNHFHGSQGIPFGRILASRCNNKFRSLL